MNQVQRPASQRAVESNIIAQHDKLLRHLAASWPHSLHEDLVQVGRIALLEASRTYVAGRGAQLWTYARRAVLGAMIDWATKETERAAREVLWEKDLWSESPSIGDGVERTVSVVDQGRDESACPESAISAAELLALLNDRQRVVVVLLLEGVETDEIAARLGVGRRQISKDLHGARRAVAQAWR